MTLCVPVFLSQFKVIGQQFEDHGYMDCEEVSPDLRV